MQNDCAIMVEMKTPVATRQRPPALRLIGQPEHPHFYTGEQLKTTVKHTGLACGVVPLGTTVKQELGITLVVCQTGMNPVVMTGFPHMRVGDWFNLT